MTSLTLQYTPGQHAQLRSLIMVSTILKCKDTGVLVRLHSAPSKFYTRILYNIEEDKVYFVTKQHTNTICNSSYLTLE